MLEHIIDQGAKLMMGSEDYASLGDLKLYASNTGTITFSFVIEPNINTAWTTGLLLIVPSNELQEYINLTAHDTKNIGSVLFQTTEKSPRTFRTSGLTRWILRPDSNESVQRYAIALYSKKFNQKFTTRGQSLFYVQKVISTADTPWNFNDSFSAVGSVPFLGKLFK